MSNQKALEMSLISQDLTCKEPTPSQHDQQPRTLSWWNDAVVVLGHWQGQGRICRQNNGSVMHSVGRPGHWV